MGGDTWALLSEEKRKSTALKIIESRKWYKHSPETIEKQKLSAHNREQNMSDEKKKERSEKYRQLAIEKGWHFPEYTLWKKGEISGFAGCNHSEESKEKIRKSRLGKSYEDIYGENAIHQKDIKRNCWLGKKNPRYIEFSNEQKKIVLNLLKIDKQKMKKLSTMAGISEGKLRQWFRVLGISNYQKLTYLPNNEWQSFWSTINVD